MRPKRWTSATCPFALLREVDVDECLSNRFAQLFAQAGHDVVQVSDRELLGSTDEEVMACAVRENRVLVSADTDFGELLAGSGGRGECGVLSTTPSERRGSGSGPRCESRRDRRAARTGFHSRADQQQNPDPPATNQGRRPRRGRDLGSKPVSLGVLTARDGALRTTEHRVGASNIEMGTMMRRTGVLRAHESASRRRSARSPGLEWSASSITIRALAARSSGSMS